MDRTSGRDRGARAAEIARPAEVVKSEARAQLPGRPKPARMKVIWEVCNGAGKVVKTFAYPEKAAAEAETRALTHSTRRAHMLRATKVPME